MTSSIQVSEPCPLERLAEHLAARPITMLPPYDIAKMADWLDYSLNRCGLVVVTEQSLAMRAKETLAQDEVGYVIPPELYSFLMGEGPLDGTWFTEINKNMPGRYWWRALLQTCNRAALGKLPGDDVREAIQFALDELKPMPRLLSQWAGGMGKQITAVRTRLRKAISAIGEP